MTVRYKDGSADEDFATDSIELAVVTPGLCVVIVEPSDDPFAVLAGVEQPFEAKAWLDGNELASEEVTWSWDFGDNTIADPDNPTVHTYEEDGGYIVIVTAMYQGQQAQDRTAAQANPPEAEGFQFFARMFGVEDHRLQGAEVSDQVELVARTAEGQVFTARFFGRMPTGEWGQLPPMDWGARYFTEEEGGLQYQAASPNTLPMEPAKNGPADFRAEVTIDTGAENPPAVGNLFLTVTANGTVVKSRPEDGQEHRF